MQRVSENYSLHSGAEEFHQEQQWQWIPLCPPQPQTLFSLSLFFSLSLSLISHCLTHSQNSVRLKEDFWRILHACLSLSLTLSLCTSHPSPSSNVCDCCVIFHRVALFLFLPDVAWLQCVSKLVVICHIVYPWFPGFSHSLPSFPLSPYTNGNGSLFQNQNLQLEQDLLLFLFP